MGHENQTSLCNLAKYDKIILYRNRVRLKTNEK